MIPKWSSWNREHIARHGVTPEEALDVVAHARPPFPREIEDEKILVCGQTEAGRYLQVIFVYLDDAEVDLHSLSPSERVRFGEGEQIIFVLHARELTDKEKRRRRRHRRRRGS